MEEENPIKEQLFEYIKNSEIKISKLLSQEKPNIIIKDIMNYFLDEIPQEGKEEHLAVLTTGILHYILTNTMIPSNRKVEFRGIQIDIVIPNLKTLEKDPKKALIIYIPKTENKKSIENQVLQLEKIQPEKQNIWIVSSNKLALKNKNFLIQKEGNFSDIIFDIANFVNVQGNNKLKILKI